MQWWSDPEKQTITHIFFAMNNSENEKCENNLIQIELCRKIRLMANDIL